MLFEYLYSRVPRLSLYVGLTSCNETNCGNTYEATKIIKTKQREKNPTLKLVEITNTSNHTCSSGSCYNEKTKSLVLIKQQRKKGRLTHYIKGRMNVRYTYRIYKSVITELILTGFTTYCHNHQFPIKVRGYGGRQGQKATHANK